MSKSTTNTNNLEKLINFAKKTAQKAYAPYSKFRVGCALQTKNQKIITAFNVENAVYGETVCAEKIAFFVALTKGYHKADFQILVIFNDNQKMIVPCGSCRQVISELASKKLKIVMVNNLNETKTTTIDKLLPFGFDDSFFS